LHRTGLPVEVFLTAVALAKEVAKTGGLENGQAVWEGNSNDSQGFAPASGGFNPILLKCETRPELRIRRAFEANHESQRDSASKPGVGTTPGYQAVAMTTLKGL
jgi:hypothetical protein